VIELLLEAERALSFGRLDRAEEIYQQVADSDPKNSIAVVGLARVALERGDDLGAYLLARHALGIDPENEAARRLAVRLEEVLATRGQPVADPLATRGQPVADPLEARPATGEPSPTAVSPAAVPPPDPGAAHLPKPAPKRRKRRSLIDRLRRT
jgi:hypothetical protein